MDVEVVGKLVSAPSNHMHGFWPDYIIIFWNGFGGVVKILM
jgi:hypothetical protein